MCALSVIPQVKVANREEVQVNSSADVQLQGLGIQHINNPPLHASLSQFPLPALVGSGHPPHVLCLPTHWISAILSSPALSLGTLCRQTFAPYRR